MRHGRHLVQGARRPLPGGQASGLRREADGGMARAWDEQAPRPPALGRDAPSAARAEPAARHELHLKGCQGRVQGRSKAAHPSADNMASSTTVARSSSSQPPTTGVLQRRARRPNGILPRLGLAATVHMTHPSRRCVTPFTCNMPMPTSVGCCSHCVLDPPHTHTHIHTSPHSPPLPTLHCRDRPRGSSTLAVTHSASSPTEYRLTSRTLRRGKPSEPGSSWSTSGTAGPTSSTLTWGISASSARSTASTSASTSSTVLSSCQWRCSSRSSGWCCRSVRPKKSKKGLWHSL